MEKGNLKVHIESVHEVKKGLRCELCDSVIKDYRQKGQKHIIKICWRNVEKRAEY